MTSYGSALESARTVSLGPWSLELRGDEIADISYSGSPILRGIRAVVRNHNWLTLSPRVRSSEVHGPGDCPALELEVEWTGFGTTYMGRLEATVEDRALTVAFQGTAAEPILSNRIGLVVLHRPDDAGHPVAVGHPDGSWTEAAFPTDISPHQPFKDIAAMSWDRDGTRFELAFAGAIFETEDQRNWTDASFKTYSTPLSRPFPVLHQAGESVTQSVRLRALHHVAILSRDIARVPELAYWLRSPADRSSADLPGALTLDVSESPTNGDGTVSPPEGLKASDTAEHGIDLRIVAGSAAEAISVLDGFPLEKITRLAVYDPVSHVTDAGTLRDLTDHARSRGFRGETLAGVRSHFTELNRNRHQVPAADGIAYSITAQMHAVEPRAVMDTVAIQPLTARQARTIGQGRPVHIGPITIAPRFNAVATQEPRNDELPAASSLEAQPFGAAWALASISALTGTDAASLCYGIPDEADTPMTRLLTALGRLKDCQVLATTGSRGGPVVYPVRTDSGITCFIANPHPWPIDVRLAAPDGATAETTIPGWDASTLNFT